MQTYEEFCDYLEPGSLKEKIKTHIKEIRRKSHHIKIPVQDLEREKEYKQIEKERLYQDLEDQEKKNQQLRERIERSEMVKLSASQKVMTMREQMRQMQEKMQEL